eukprot:1559164-Pleurochrysis_carterae.AAC.1
MGANCSWLISLGMRAAASICLTPPRSVSFTPSCAALTKCAMRQRRVSPNFRLGHHACLPQGRGKQAAHATARRQRLPCLRLSLSPLLSLPAHTPALSPLACSFTPTLTHPTRSALTLQTHAFPHLPHRFYPVSPGRRVSKAKRSCCVQPPTRQRSSAARRLAKRGTRRPLKPEPQRRCLKRERRRRRRSFALAHARCAPL